MTKPEMNHRPKQRGGFFRPGKQRKTEQAELQAYIPPYLRQFVTPYHGEFCFTRTCHYRLVAQLMVEGFLPIATEGVILPKLHKERCVIFLPQDLHISKSVRKKAKKYTFTVNREFDRVVQACKQQHGPRCWLYPELVQVFRDLHQAGYVDAVIFPTRQGGTAPNAQCTVLTRQQSPVRLYSIEVWTEETGELVAGELGYSVGSIYTSLTGFSAQNNAGSVQLVALGRLLCTLGFDMWDLGMDMEYKRTLGSHLIPRREFVDHVHKVRSTKGHLVLPLSINAFNCRQLIDQELNREELLRGSSKSSEDTTSAVVTITSNIENDTRSISNVHFHPVKESDGSPEPEKDKTHGKIRSNMGES